MNKTRMGKRVASLLLSLVMMLSLLPTAAYATTMADGVDTQGASVSENGTGVSDDSNSSGNTDDLQVGDSEDGGNTGDQKVEGSNGSNTVGDTAGTEGGADPTDSVNENDSTLVTPSNRVEVNGTVYDTLEAAIAAAEPVNGVITYEIYGKVEANSTESWIEVLKAGLTDVTKVAFVGKTDDAEISITNSTSVLADQNYDIDVSFVDLTLSHSNGAWVGDLGHATEYFTCVLRNTDAANNTVTYTNCTFPNGACNNQYGKTVFVNCEFTNTTSGKYNLWNYGGTTEITKSAFTGTRGIKTYNEGTLAESPEVAIKDTTFTGLTEKAAIVASKPTDIKLDSISATECTKGVFQKDIEGSADAEKVTIEANGSGISGNFNVTAEKTTEAAKDEFNITAGSFTAEVPSDYCAEGFTIEKKADGSYGVKVGADGYVEDENGNVTISTAEGLFYFAKKVNAGNNFAGKTVTLANNIDLNNEKWTPIGIYGTQATWFKGTFDGQNHAVTGLKVEESRKNGVGFFSKVYTGTIKNLTVEGSVSAPGCTYVGGIVGHGYATITNCTFKGTVSGSGAAQVGGIAGSGGFTVDRCSVYGDVSAGCWAGGIVGNCQDGGAYTNCYVEGTISSESTFWGGGAAGITPDPRYPSQVISGCYSNTVVKVAGEEVNCPIIAAYNNPLDYKGYSGGLKIYDNSWNKQKNSNDSYPIYAEKDGKGGVLMEGMTAARDNSLIMLEDDLNYVTGDLSKVRIMAGSSVTQAQIDALAVASVGDSKYQFLTEAINAAQDGQTVRLLADVAEDVVISKSIALDLGGKTLTNTNAGKATISVQSGTVTVKNGNVKGGTGYYNIEAKKDANLTLTDVAATAGNTGSSMIDNWGTLTITSGTYTGGLNVVKSEEGSVLNISGGTFTRETAPRWGITGTVLVYGTTTITGGTFNEKSTSTNARVVVTGRVDGYDSITYVKGGTFNGNGNNVFHHLSPAQADDSFEVSGGTFNKSIPDYYCADGFIPTKNAGGTYGVKEGQYVAKVGSKKYETLADAIRLAAKGKTITLLADVEQNTQLTINKSITLDLNGKTIRNTVDIWGDKANAILSITNGAKVTITGNGTIDAKENGCYTINVVKGDLTIENGTFYGNVSVVQVEEGTLSVKGGTFDLHQKWEGSSMYLFNCIDEAYVDGSANVAISGGTFVGFDPSASPEGEGTSYLAPGYAPVANANGTYGVKLAEGPYQLQDYRSGDHASWTYPTQEGKAFAGWYKDAAFTTPCAASDVEGAAYAKFVNITDLLQFKGGSLRMDVTDPSTSTYLRFGYTMAIPEKSAFIENGWYYKKVTVSSPDDVRFVAYNNAMNKDGTVTANLVFNGVKAGLYTANFTEKAFVKYVTVDGTTVEAVESDYQTRSVDEVADAILKHPMASNSEKEYALKIKSAIQQKVE